MTRKDIQMLKRQPIPKTLTNAKDLAKAVTKDFSLQECPIPLVETITSLGFSIYATSIKAMIAGFVLVSPELTAEYGSDKVMAIDIRDSYTHQREVLADLLSHYLFNFDEEHNCTYLYSHHAIPSYLPGEEVHHAFVSELLMPVRLFTAKYRELNSATQYERVSQLMSVFAVSQDTVLKRIKELNLC